MPVTSSKFAYTPHDTTWDIADTLDNINDAIGGTLAETRAGAKALLKSVPTLYRCEVEAGVFPALEVSGGTLVAADGTAYAFDPGTLTADTTASSTQLVFINSFYAIDIDDELPEDAVLFLATVVVNGAGTDFESVTFSPYRELHYHDAVGNIELARLMSGPIPLRSQSWFNNADGVPTRAYENVRGYTVQNEVVLDEETGLPASVDDVIHGTGLNLCDGLLLANGAELASGYTGV